MSATRPLSGGNADISQRCMPPKQSVLINAQVGSLTVVKQCFLSRHGRPSRGCRFDSAVPKSVLDALHLDMEAIAKMTAVARTGREKSASFFRAFGFDTPLLGAHHEHCGVERLQCGFGLLF
jgi:hypothetical protein